jgi:hypothetical protein
MGLCQFLIYIHQPQTRAEPQVFGKILFLNFVLKLPSVTTLIYTHLNKAFQIS